MPVSLLRQHGYDGRILPITPRAESIQGLPAAPDLAALDGEADLVILAVPAALAAQALEQARPGQVGGAVVCAPSPASAASGCWAPIAWAT
ncbi:hypothetical protein G6F50_017721 [Rhizopus delemar]|uniref:CoA-binding domain-containing protein n=1 Tax=Rhizopus delemar TaxID=936053 RepID=A0A9P7BZT8_9FUNG|nr:hypothetical protein G6F50_017721 [Rhizopus delemar]